MKKSQLVFIILINDILLYMGAGFRYVYEKTLPFQRQGFNIQLRLFLLQDTELNPILHNEQHSRSNCHNRFCLKSQSCIAEYSTMM